MKSSDIKVGQTLISKTFLPFVVQAKHHGWIKVRAATPGFEDLQYNVRASAFIYEQPAAHSFPVGGVTPGYGGRSW